MDLKTRKQPASDNPFSQDKMRERIRKSEEDFRSGRVVSQKELEKKLELCLSE